MSYELRRRDLLKSAAALFALPLADVAFAGRSGEQKLVFVVLRGGMDGLAAVAPYRDLDYGRLRGSLALPEPGATNGLLELVDGFGLHPKLTFLHERWSAEQLSFLHAASTPYRERSHFDGQDVLESGADRVFGQDTGWLARALAALPGEATGVGVGGTVPLALRGPAKASSWAPSVVPPASDDTLARLMDLYSDDAAFSADLAMAIQTAELIGDREGKAKDRGWTALAEATAKLLVAPGGPAAAVLGLEGFDTHANQGTTDGALAGRLVDLDAALRALHAGLGEAWSRTAVVVVSEFGRTAAVNGTDGTDHGTGGVAFLLGGGVRGRRRLGEWPTLATLHEGRDLLPANDVRSLFAGVLREHWGVDHGVFDDRVTPLPKLFG